MAIPQVKSFRWLSTPSAWAQSQAWRSRQQDLSASFQSANTAAGATFASASVGLTSGLADIATKTAVSRIRAKAAMAALNKLV
jgi:hypothetical protein